MVRIKRGSRARLKRGKILRYAKGYRGAHSKLFRTANQQVSKALRYAYAHRRKRKRIFRSKHIVQINGIAKSYGTSYNQLISRMGQMSIGLNRQMLAKMANLDLNAFTVVTGMGTLN